MTRSFRYLLQPTARQRVELDALLARQCELYNAALEERIGAWKWEGRSVSQFDQNRTLTTLRSVRPDILAQGTYVCRGTLKRLDRAFAGFHRRHRAGQKPGFPRFKPSQRWNSVEWTQDRGWKLDTERKRFHVQGLGDIKVRLHRPLQGVPVTASVQRDGRRWWVTVNCTDVPTRRLEPTGKAVGIDLGVCALVATSDGELITAPRYERASAARLAAAQRGLATKCGGSNRRKRAVERVARAHRKARNQRRDFAHKLSRSLVDNHDLIVHEDLEIVNMVRRGSPRKTGLNRSIHDAGWGELLAKIAYKAEDAGRDLVAVNPAYTSQRCAECGHTERANRRSQAVFRCMSCDHEDHADINAALNILQAGRALQASACGAVSPALPEAP